MRMLLTRHGELTQLSIRFAHGILFFVGPFRFIGLPSFTKPPYIIEPSHDPPSQSENKNRNNHLSFNATKLCKSISVKTTLEFRMYLNDVWNKF